MESKRLCHLGLTVCGHPRHPLYVRGDTQRISYDFDELMEEK